jgi:hypothetical protein
MQSCFALRTRRATVAVCLVVASMTGAANGQYTWRGGNGAWFDAARWGPFSLVPNDRDLRVEIDGGKTTASVVEFTSPGITFYPGIGQLTIDEGDTLAMRGFGFLEINRGRLTVNGTLTALPASNGTVSMTTANSQNVIAGSGLIVLSSTDQSVSTGVFLANASSMSRAAVRLAARSICPRHSRSPNPSASCV